MIATLALATLVPIGAGQSVDVHAIGVVPADRVALLVRLADLSTCTQDPLAVDCNGLIEPGDRVVVTDRLVVWLDLGPGALDITNGGAGLVRGVWPIALDGGGQANFVNIENAANWAPNELYPGADGAGNQGSGMSIQLRLIENIDVPDPHSMGAENDPTTLALDGAPICDGGLFQGDGIFVQTTGYLVHFERDAGVLAAYGFASAQDASEDPAVLSRLRYTITYRFSPDAPRFRQEVALEVVDGATSNIASYTMSSCGHGSMPGSASWHGADVGRIRNQAVVPPSCSRSPSVAAGQVVQFNKGVIGAGGLDYFESASYGAPGYAWFLTAQPGIGGRTMSLTLPAGFTPAVRVQALLNGYSAPGTGVVCLDVGYEDDNECGADAGWPVGAIHRTAVDYYFDPGVPQTGAWPPSDDPGGGPACPAMPDAAPPGTVDASTPGGSDGGLGPDAGTPDDGDGGGCGCNAGSTRGSWPAVLLLFVLACIRRRSRRT